MLNLNIALQHNCPIFFDTRFGQANAFHFDGDVPIIPAGA
jgi:hypothetical protein